MRFKIQLDNQEMDFEVVRQGDRLKIAYGDSRYDARLIYTDGPHFVLEVEEPGPDDFVFRKRIRAAGFREGEKRQLWANGRLVNYVRVREGVPAPSIDESAQLSASIPAIVSEILVAENDAVKAGDKLILLESMKMIIPIQAPRDGVVKAVKCGAGEAVQPGRPLVELGDVI